MRTLTLIHLCSHKMHLHGWCFEPTYSLLIHTNDDSQNKNRPGLVLVVYLDVVQTDIITIDYT
jgi:hypothetical protein